MTKIGLFKCADCRKPVPYKYESTAHPGNCQKCVVAQEKWAKAEWGIQRMVIVEGIRMYNAIHQIPIDTLFERFCKGLSLESQQEVLDQLLERGPVTGKEISDALGMLMVMNERKKGEK